MIDYLLFTNPKRREDGTTGEGFVPEHGKQYVVGDDRAIVELTRHFLGRDRNRTGVQAQLFEHYRTALLAATLHTDTVRPATANCFIWGS